jgi:dCTP diphosphatase
MADIESFVTELRQFVAEREWSQFHNAKNLSMLLASEVGELVAEYRWVPDVSADQHSRTEPARARIEDEIGDVAIALLLLCDRIGVDPLDAASRKLAKTRERYPVEKARGKAERPEE